MRKLLFVALILVISAGWAVAQNPTSPPPTENPGAQSPSNPQAQPTEPGQPSQQPGMPGEASQQPGAAQAGQTGQESSSTNTVEGCLAGSAGNYTVVDKSGTSHQLNLPPNADTSKLDQHVGEEVRVTGATGSGQQSSYSQPATGGAAATGSSSAISVTKIDKIGDKCNSNAQKPPSK